MLKNDRKSLFITILTDIIILVILIIIKIDIPSKVDAKISVGLIEYMEEDRKVTPKKQEEEKEKPSEPAEKPREEIVEKPVEEVVKEIPKDIKQEKQELVLPDIIPVPDINLDTLIAKNPSERKVSIAPKEDIRQERVFKEEQKEMIEIKGAELEKREIAKVEVTPIQSEGEIGKIVVEKQNTEGEIEGLDSNLASESDKLEGLPKGYKDIGSIDGNITGKWDESNKLPVYPESAELAGKTGTVVLKVYVTEEGRVERVEMGGSGVPELNRAVEKVARTWRIYLSKNGQRVYGNVTLEIPFRLLRGE